MLRIPLLLSFCLLTAHACIPMNPGEELECPSPPKIPRLPANTSDLEYSDLLGPVVTANDEAIYYCDFTMFMQHPNGESVEWELVCKPNSGFWILRNTETGKETMPDPKTTFACKEVACNPKMIEYDGNIPAPYLDGGPIQIVKGENDTTAACPKGSLLYMFTAVGPALVMEDAEPTCERNTGIWNGDMVFKCLKKTCKPPIVATTNTDYCAPMHTCDRAKLDPMPTTIVSCMDGYSVSYVEMGSNDPPSLASQLRCDSESGLWKTPDSRESIMIPQITCATPSMCQSCAAPMVLAPTNDLCKNPTNFFCSAMATYVMDPCHRISCAADSKLSVVKADKTITPLAGNAICEGGMWKVSGVVQNLLPNVVCSKPNNCDKCEAIVKPTYMEQAMYTDNVKKVKTGSTCTFTCSKTDTEMISATKPYDSITCDTTTEKAVFTGDTALAPWTCAKCDCKVGNGKCPGHLAECKAPTNVKPCVYSCPAGTEAWYKTTSNGLLASIPAGEYRCQGNKINGIANYMDGLMCGRPWAVGSPTVPPDEKWEVCPMLKEDTPVKIGGVDVPTNFGDLRYSLEKDDRFENLFVTCLTGVLVSTNPNYIVPAGKFDRLQCYNEGFLPGMTKANCVDKKYVIDGCLAYLVAGDHYNTDCMNGVCTITCKNANLKMFLYSMNTPGLRIATKGAWCQPSSFNPTRKLHTLEGEPAVNAAPTATQMQGCFMA